jgi:hypothetical protein
MHYFPVSWNISVLLLIPLFIQIADKHHRQMAEARIAELEAEKKKEEAKLEEQKVLQELRKMEAAGYNPSVSSFNIDNLLCFT